MPVRLATCVLLASALVSVGAAARPVTAAEPQEIEAGHAVAIEVDRAHCAIRTDGTLGCWDFGAAAGATAPLPGGAMTGLGVKGETVCGLGEDGGVSCLSLHTGLAYVPAGGPFTAIGGLCALGADGSATCWDLAGNPVAAAAGPFIEVSGGMAHGCGVREDRTLACWGVDWSGEASPPEGEFDSVTVGYGASCAIAVDGTLDCWGHIAAPPAGIYAAVSVGWSHACALAADGTITCWGDDISGALDAPAGNYLAVTAGDAVSCGLRADGLVVCWGVIWPPYTATPIAGPVPELAMTRRIPLAWRSIEALDRVESYDVRAGWYEPSGDFVATRLLTGSTATEATVPLRPGHQWCISVRTREASGIVSLWTMPWPVCTVVPHDDRALTRSGAWRRIDDDERLYRGTGLRTTSRGATLRWNGYIGSLRLVATTCPGCGTVKVFSGSRLVARISLDSPQREDRVVIPVWQWHWGEIRRITVKVVSTGKPVIIDGFAATEPLYSDGRN